MCSDEMTNKLKETDALTYLNKVIFPNLHDLARQARKGVDGDCVVYVREVIQEVDEACCVG